MRWEGVAEWGEGVIEVRFIRAQGDEMRFQNLFSDEDGCVDEDEIPRGGDGDI